MLTATPPARLDPRMRVTGLVSGHMSSSTRMLTGRRADTVERLVDVTVAEVAEAGYDGLTVRSVARRAGVAPATAYTYFSSKGHLVA
jgi:AcrR family transcriptional regulator